MPALKITVLAEVDGQPLTGFPYVRRVVADAIQSFAPYLKAGDSNTSTFTALPTSALPTMQGLLVHADQDMTVRLNGQSDAGVLVKAGGLLLAFDTTMTAGATTNATVNINLPGTTIAQIRGLGIGTTP